MTSVLTALLLFATPDAGAVRQATQQESARIRAQIGKAFLMDAEVRQAEIAIQRAEATGISEEISLAQAQLRKVKDRQDAAFTVAIHLAIAAYDLAPAEGKVPSVMSVTAGRKIEWLPVARDPEERTVYDAEGNSVTFEKPEKTTAGVTYADGTSYLNRDAFLHGPGWLASTLLHERTHFDQFTTEGRGDVLLPSEREAEAFAAELAHQRLFFHAVRDKTLLDELKGLHSEAAQKAAADRERLSTVRGKVSDYLFGDPDGYGLRPHTDEELAVIEAMVAEARKPFESTAVATGAIEQLRFPQAVEPLIARPLAPKIPQEVLDTLQLARTYFGTMQMIVADACERPESIDEYRAGEFGSAWMKAVIALDSARSRTGLELPVSERSLYEGLKGCQFDVMKAFLEKPLWFPLNTGDWGWARSTALSVYRSYHPTPEPLERARPREPDASGRTITPRYGPAYRQAEKWPRN